ncbi:FAD-dependent oxidoreductase [Microbacterium hydrocarbonoxydans]|uniref:FAD-dependent oxidoreductase n=1 Tax=Microbacterium hydrocarbonoxydans TaxID=273678 RepID=UPI0007BC0F94|nr:NAD(P)/FAD-dependent oxidoreductase [Microbacterium hydrocarbonoxydans]GAT73529.1 monooxygenase FAD-binding protein [Microbacterium sp. HM58-2]
MIDHEVIIVGAGPVGLLLACLLAQQRVDVVVCERRPDADTRSRAIGIHRPGLDALDAAGIGAEVRAEALALEGGEVRSRGRVLAALSFPPERPVLILPQRRTDALLRERFDRLAAGRLLAGHVVRGVRDEEDFARVAVDGGHGLREMTCELVVIADGVHSALREQLGIPWCERPGRGRYAMLDVRDEAAGARAALHCEPRGLVEAFPMPGGRRRWVVRDAVGEPDLGTAAGFRRAIEERTGIRADIPDDATPVGFRAGQHAASGFGRGRIALLGDAAHEISPIGGQGMNLGWSHAMRLAEDVGRSLGAEPDLRRYAKGAPRAARIAQRRSAFYMSMGVPASGVPLHSRELLIRALGSPPLRGWATGLITMRGL